MVLYGLFEALYQTLEMISKGVSMKIVLGTKGSRGYHYDSPMSGENFLSGVLGKGNVRYQVGTEMINTGFDMPASPLIQALFYAFSQHFPIKIEPAFFWTTIIQEVATMVKQNPTRFASVFHGDPNDKRLVKVICDELYGNDEAWPLAIGRFRTELAKETGPALVEGFFPNFSSDDETRELAYLVSAMDAASPFFKYEVHTRCGIPEIQLEGTLEDWSKLYGRILWLEFTFGKCEYFDGLKKLIDRIGRQVKVNQPDVEFWMSMFKYHQQSGGDRVTGWIADLYAHTYTQNGAVLKTKKDEYGYSLNAFPSGLSVVPFIWQVIEKRFPMRFFAGLTGIKMEGGVLVPTIGYGVIEGDVCEK
ncbi:MAG: hypothetical protein ACD_61C00054G0006 [uncultured bacterium]|nr:MAG: hypothetical protein ACD_61C00054G0006 [uncultured bacterium]